jgi:DNA-binding FadR family transcriptional regulator
LDVNNFARTSSLGRRPDRQAYSEPDLRFHRAILDEMWRRSPDGARRAMHELLDLTERNIISALSRRNNEDRLPEARTHP